MRHITLLAFVLLAIAEPAGASDMGAAYTLSSVALPGGSEAGISMDYIAFDPATGFVWVPAGNTGAVDVVDTATGKVTSIPGFATAEMQAASTKRVVGPSSVTVGKGVVYIGNRGDSSVTLVNSRTLASGTSVKLDSMPDGLAYVAATKEVWVTTPRDKSIRVLDATSLAEKAKLPFDGNPEGFAVDAARGRFYTNLEDKDLTLAIDLKTHKTVATWKPACGEEGPHGLALDERAGLLFVACSTRVEALDVAHDGAVVSSVDTGDGVDSIDYAPSTHLVYVAAAKAAKLTVARVDAHGKLTVVAQVPTRTGARNGVVGNRGVVYLAHSRLAALNELVVLSPGAR
jgi:DNA-binding beta-propeller fold protein YncE